MAARELRKAQEAELAAAPVADDARGRTVDDAANALCERLELQGARKAYRQNCESMQRVDISPAMGSRRVGEVSTADVEALARSMLRRGLAAAVTGLRQSELLGIRWRDIDVTASRVRVRNAFVRGEHSSEGKSDLSTRRSVPMADWLALELAAWRERTAFDHNDDLVFAHRSWIGRLIHRRSRSASRPRAARRACARSGSTISAMRSRRSLAASGAPLRAIQEFLGHADLKTTQIYAHYAPSGWEVDGGDPRDAPGARARLRRHRARASRRRFSSASLRARRAPQA